MTPLWAAIPVIAAACASAGLLVYWSVAWYRMVRTMIALPTARAGLALARRSTPPGRVCVVVPAHDEEVSVEALVASLRAQDHPDARFVLALDRCTDRTEELARGAIGDDARFEVVAIDACPDDWAGKVHAVWAGLTRSEGARTADYLLFTDADCRLHPSCLSASVALLEERGLDMLSLFSTLDTRDWFEQIVQPVTSFELARQYPLMRANDPDASRRRPFANGQFMLFRRGAYDRAGGHESVRGALLEDIDLSRRMTALGFRTGLLLADGVVRCKMYDSWAQFRRGWKRIYTESANRRARRLRKLARRMVVVGAVLPGCAVVGAVLTLALVPADDRVLFWVGVGLPAAALAAWGAAQLLIHVMGRMPVWAIALHPVGALLTAGILREAAADLDGGVATTWGGRVYARDRR